MFALVAWFECRDEEAAAQFDALTADAVALITEREPGTLVYATHRLQDSALARVFYEVYRDHDAFQEHENAEHVREFHAKKNPLLAGEPRVEFLTPRSAKGLVGG